MQPSTLDVLDAYRADLSNANKSEFSTSDGLWLAFGTLLQRAVTLEQGKRPAYLAAGATALARELGSTETVEAIRLLARQVASAEVASAAICAGAMVVAAEAENAGSFAVATAILDASRNLVGLSEVRLQGRLLAQQARILRKIGELDVAVELCDEVGRLGAINDDRELIGLAHLGRGVAARMRGNYPTARAEFSAVLDAVSAVKDLEELRLHAHHGLLVASAVAHDFEAALRHGSLALEAAQRDEQRVEILQNLATVCYDIGQYRSALHGYLEALKETQAPRVRMAALGGAAVAAARLGEPEMVRILVASAAPLVTQRGHEYELADMIREFSEAYSHLGDAELFERYRREAVERAQRGGFFEIAHRLESFSAATRSVQRREIALTREALAIAKHLASGDSGQLLAAAVSSDRRD